MNEAAITPSTIGLAALLNLKGIGRRAALRIISSPLEAGSARDHLAELARAAKVSDLDVAGAWSKAEDNLDRSIDSGIKAFSFHDEGYPERLRHMPDPPAILYVKGDTSGLHAAHSIAVIGTREPTAYGEKVARRSAATATEQRFVVVSGLAHGCDTLGHEGCLDQNGVGVAVMAHGLEKVYPAANRGLASRLLDAGGCLVSEYPLGMTPMRTAFAERDRIQSGLSDAVLVIETDVKGGTMHTVRFSREQKRALACIDHPESWRHEPKTQGNQMLIADKWAVPIADGDALLSFLNSVKAVEKLAPTDSPVKTGKSQISMDF
jgi:DNA processing protein